MWPNASPKRQETNEIPLFGQDWPVCQTCRQASAVQTGSECPQSVILFWAILWCWRKHQQQGLTVKWHRVKQNSERRGRKQAHCWIMHVSPFHSFPLVYSVFHFFKVDLLIQNCDHGCFQWIWLTSCTVGYRNGCVRRLKDTWSLFPCLGGMI